MRPGSERLLAQAHAGHRRPQAIYRREIALVRSGRTWAAATLAEQRGKPVKDEVVATLDALIERGGALALGALVAVVVLRRLGGEARHGVEAAFEQQRRFLREASHELRTPITIGRGHLDVLGERPSGGEVREARAIVIDELDRMGRIVDDMTTLARSEDLGSSPPSGPR